MKYLITGGGGFLGSNICCELLNKGENVVVFDNLSRAGSFQNLNWLQTLGEFQFVHGDIRSANDVVRLIQDFKPDVIYHLAGQVAMTTSVSDPRMDFEVNAHGSFNLLDAVRAHSPHSIVIYSSTNKVYGDLEQFSYKETETRYECVDMPQGFDESVCLNFHSPYGTSKGCADQYMLDYARMFDVRTVVFRHSSMYGGRQFSTFDQGWVGWFVGQAVAIRKGNSPDLFTISGNGKQVRDVLYASDTVSLYLKAVESIDLIKGQAFNIGGGIENSLSLLELFELLENMLDIKMSFIQLPARKSDQRYFVADCSKVRDLTGWNAKISSTEGVQKMLDWVDSIDAL